VWVRGYLTKTVFDTFHKTRHDMTRQDLLCTTNLPGPEGQRVVSCRANWSLGFNTAVRQLNRQTQKNKLTNTGKVTIPAKLISCPVILRGMRTAKKTRRLHYSRVAYEAMKRTMLLWWPAADSIAVYSYAADSGHRWGSRFVLSGKCSRKQESVLPHDYFYTVAAATPHPQRNVQEVIFSISNGTQLNCVSCSAVVFQLVTRT